MGHLFRSACDLDSKQCILSIDGIGPFDHIKRAAMLRKLLSLPGARGALPFVLLSYGAATEYVWNPTTGRRTSAIKARAVSKVVTATACTGLESSRPWR